MTQSSAMERYMAALTRSYELLTEASGNANDRGLAVGKRFLDDLATGQKEAADLNTRLAGGADQVAMSYPSIMAASLAAQARALSFTQLLNDTSSASSTEHKAVLEELAALGRECAEAAAEIVRSWTTDNPLAAMAMQSMSAFGGGVAPKAD